MASRFVMHRGDWESVFGRLQELVMANSGEDEFIEIFKLLIAKLYSERDTNGRYQFRSYGSVGETAEAVNALVGLASDRWRGILEGPAVSRLTDEHLSVCVEALEGCSIVDSSLEVMDGAFEYLVNRAAKGDKGQYFTPRHVIECCVQIMDPSAKESVADPACGSGGFLIHTLNHVETQLQGEDKSVYCAKRVWGFDFEPRAVQVAKALMLIAGDGQANIFRLNSLVRGNRRQLSLSDKQNAGVAVTIEDVIRLRNRSQGGFDVVMTNPPFAGEIRENGLLEGYDLNRKGRRVERDVLFLERCVDILRPRGRLAIVLPYNKLGSPAWSYVREWLYQHVRIIGVLGLGRNTFLPHTHQKASVVFGIKRDRILNTVPRENILFMISEKDGKDSSGRTILRPNSDGEKGMWLVADHDFEDVVREFRRFIRQEKIDWGGA